MYSFGKNKIRSLDCFGISGVLGENSQIYYQPLFSPRHLGRVSDLVSVRLKQEGLDELRLRASLLLGFFQGYRGQFQTKKTINPFKKKDDGSLEDPVLLEVGIDQEKVCIGICFNLNSDTLLNSDGLSERIEKNVPSGSLEQSLVELQARADRVILKYQPGTRRVELILVLGILGKIDLESIRKKQPVTVIVFNESEIKQAPRPKVYQALGDLDYAQLLKLDEREKSFQPDSIKEEKTTVAALPKTEPELIQVVGATPEEPSVTQVISGGQPAKQKERSSFRKPLGGVKGLIQGIFGKLWNRGQSSEGSEESDEGDYDEEWVVEGGPALDPNEGVVLVKDHLETDSLDDDGTTVIEGGHLDEVLRNARENLVTFKKDIKNEKTRLWMESLINDVMKERADLKQIHRKLNSSFRQKEFEFRKKYLLLQEELKLKDEEILKRETALNRTKEQLNQVTINIEKFKNVSQELSSEMQFRQKYHASQKMNQLAKEENAQLSRRIEELRVQLNAAQVARIQNSPTAELSALQIKYDRLYRQSEEFKKANRQLMEHLNEVKRDSGGMPNHVDELKSRLDAAMKLAMTSKKDAEMMRSKIAQMLQKESNLRAEVMKMKAQLNLSPSKIKGDGENQS